MKQAYGIDCSDRHLVVVRVRGRAAAETLVQSGPGRIPEGFARQIAADVAAGRATCVAALGCHEAVLRRVTAPFPQRERALKVFPSVLDVQLPFPLEQCATAFTGFSPATTGGTDALALAARREDVQRALQRCDGAGFDPVVLDHEGLALWDQAAHDTPADDEDGRVVLHVGPAHMTLVYGTGGRLLGAHGARLGAGDPGDAVARARTLATRIRTWLQAQTVFTATARTRWLVSGAGAEEAALLDAVRREMSPTRWQVAAEPASHLARALARRGLTPGPLGCNLRTGPQEHPQARRLVASRGRQRVWLALAAGLMLCAVNVAGLWYAQRRNDDVQDRIQRMARELTGAPAPRGQETLVVRRALEQQAATGLPFRRVASDGVSASLAGLLKILDTNRIVVSHLAIDSEQVRFVARDRDAREVEQAAIDLKHAGWKTKTVKTEAGLALEGSRR